VCLSLKFNNPFLVLCFLNVLIISSYNAHCKNIQVKNYFFAISDTSKLKEININVDKFFQDIEKKETKEKLKLLTDEAFSKKIFGAPTFFYNNKIYWGQDRLDYVIDEALK